MPDFQERGAHDYRKDACLTLEDFERIVVRCIVYYNSERVISDYPYTEAMIKKQIRPYACEIWNWKVQEPGTNLITATDKEIVLALLPRTEGRFTRYGLVVNKMRYHREGYKEAYLKGGICTVAYNPDDVSHVWLRVEEGFEQFRIIETMYAELHAEHRVVVRVKIQISFSGLLIFDHVEITGLMSAGIDQIFNYFIRTEKGVGLPDREGGFRTGEFDPADIFACLVTPQDVGSVHALGGEESTVGIFENRRDEITASSPVTEELLEDHRALNRLCHEMDSTRPTVMAHAFMLEKDSPLIPIADIASYNLYFGWYLGTLEQNEQFFDEYHAMFPDRVIGFSEYGADCNPQFYSARPEQGDYTEEYQCVYHEHILRCIEERPFLWATHVWNLFDFAADGRDEGGKNGQNQKGLVEFDHKTKKDAFYLYKAAWSKEPFVHICGRRFVDRTGDKTQIKVYSNQSEIKLLVDGAEVAKESGAKVFRFEIPLTGEHRIEAVSGVLTDEIRIRKVEKANPEYSFGDAGEVVNWFDKDEIDPAYFSIRDKFGDLMRHTATAAIVGKIMEKAQASRGDVAKSTSENKVLQQMLAQMSFESLLKHAGANVVPPEMVKAINDMLQKVKKD